MRSYFLYGAFAMQFYALEGLAQLMKTVSVVRANFNPTCFARDCVTMYDSRNKLSEMVESDVRGHFGEQVYQTVIPRNVRVSEARPLVNLC